VLRERLGGDARERQEEAGGALQAHLGAPAGADLEDGAVLGGGLVAEVGDERRDVLGLEAIDELLGHDGGGHARAGDGRDGVDKDVALGALLGERRGEADERHFGGRVVGLAKVAVEAGGRGGVDDAAKALIAHEREGGARDGVGALDVNVVNEIPVTVGHAVEGDVAQNAGVVDDDVDAPKGVDGSLHDFGAVQHRVVVGHSRAAQCANLVHHLVGGARRAAFVAFRVAAQVVHNHFGATTREFKRMRSTQSTASAY
jgi:hypothetical protein